MDDYYSDSSSDIELDDEFDSTYSESSDSSDLSDDDDEIEIDVPPASNVWGCVIEEFVPRKSVPEYKATETTIADNSSGTEIFLKLFPRSLLMFISECTNERLNILARKKEKRD